MSAIFRGIKLYGFLLLGLSVNACSSSHWISGTTIDFDNGEAVPHATVVVEQTGWGRVNERIVWDKVYQYEALSDDDGRFYIQYDTGSSAHVVVKKEGFATHDGWYPKNSDISIRLKKEIVVPTSLEHGFLEIGRDESRPYGWIFVEARRTFEQGEADIFPEFDEKGTTLININSPEQGGLVFVHENELGVASDYLIYTDTAPEDGYRNSVPLNLSNTNGVFFVQTFASGHYAKFAFDSRSYATNGSPQSNTWGLLLEYVYNADGTRNLAYRGEYQ